MDNQKHPLLAETTINAPIGKVWELWTQPHHIAKWNNASEDWHTPKAENDLRIGGRMFLRMETKDGSSGFDFNCIYDEVQTNEKLSYTLSDGRKSVITFKETVNGIVVTETFEPVDIHPPDIQQAFCQAILDNFKAYVERSA